MALGSTSKKEQERIDEPVSGVFGAANRYASQMVPLEKLLGHAKNIPDEAEREKVLFAARMTYRTYFEAFTAGAVWRDNQTAKIERTKTT